MTTTSSACNIIIVSNDVEVHRKSHYEDTSSDQSHDPNRQISCFFGHFLT
jgi:hypothetical protein